jgi:cobalt/nickel transport system permease protein
MNTHWLAHSHAPTSRVHHWPAAVKLGGALVIILGSVSLPPGFSIWFWAVGLLLVGVAGLSRLSPLFLLRRLLVLSPFALVNAGQPAARATFPAIALKSSLCLFTVILVSHTTPFSEILRVLQRVRAPVLLITTLALMHRYLFVLAGEAERMRRARASRTFGGRRRLHWQMLATVVGQLFVRASERAERIYDAMCARGWK